MEWTLSVKKFWLYNLSKLKKEVLQEGKFGIRLSTNSLEIPRFKVTKHSVREQ